MSIRYLVKQLKPKERLLQVMLLILRHVTLKQPFGLCIALMYSLKVIQGRAITRLLALLS
ncbi:hypothetical protein RU08_16835 [Pseudomonas fulva]|uniref:Uncharacterized protein n=1 Tax=Pseudomonas fulva TaxID=47880 RepID=A0A0D0KG56_9PSED|nr:hypothetical protein RU08_16835 [Pseudomonas fulva]